MYFAIETTAIETKIGTSESKRQKYVFKSKHSHIVRIVFYVTLLLKYNKLSIELLKRSVGNGVNTKLSPCCTWSVIKSTTAMLT